jgi:hypothetical protein
LLRKSRRRGTTPEKRLQLKSYLGLVARFGRLGDQHLCTTGSEEGNVMLPIGG